MKKYLVLFMLLVSAFVLTSCSGGNKIDKDFVDLTEKVANGEKVTIKFRYISGVVSDAMPDLIAGFNQVYPNVTVEPDIVTGGYTDLRKLTNWDIKSSKAPTMVIGYPDHFYEYYSALVLTNLQYLIEGKNGFTNEELADFVPSYLEEGKGFDSENPEDLYTLPFNKSTEVLVYNKTMIEAAASLDNSITIPKTWEEVSTFSQKIIDLVAAKKLDDVVQVADGEKKPSELLAAGLFVPFAYDSNANAFITMTRQFGGEYTQKVAYNKGLAKFNNANNIAALNYFKDEAIAKRFAIAETFSSNYASDAFKLLKTFMTVGSSAGVGYNVPSGNKFQIGVSSIPYSAVNPDNKYVIQQGTNVAILAQSTNLQRSAAWLFIKYLMQPENTAKFAMATGGYLPVRTSAYETADYAEYLVNPPIEKKNHSLAANVALNYINNGYKFFVDPAFVGSSLVRDEVGYAFSAIIVNKKNVEARILEAYNTLGPSFQPEQ